MSKMDVPKTEALIRSKIDLQQSCQQWHSLPSETGAKQSSRGTMNLWMGNSETQSSSLQT